MTDSTGLIPPERAKLIPVTGTDDQADLSNAVDVQFNPTTLKVTMSNTLRENQRNSNSRSAQFVDKSSSTLAVELIFDTTFVEEGQSTAAGSDVRLLTKQIAEKFIKPKGTGRNMEAPDRCLFQWGAFEFIGMVESYEETLDFFAPEGIPLRATVSLKLSEDRFQFRQREIQQAERETPTFGSTGNAGNEDADSENNDATSAPSQDTSPVQRGSASEQRNWRDAALYNGIESPRLPSGPLVAYPKMSITQSMGISAGVSVSASVKVSTAAEVGERAATDAPAFRFGASTSVGTGIGGAFSLNAASGLSAGRIIAGKATLLGAGNASVKNKTDIDSGESGVGFE